MPEKRSTSCRDGPAFTKRIASVRGAGRVSVVYRAGIMKLTTQVSPPAPPASSGVGATGTVIAIFSPVALPPKIWPASTRKPFWIALDLLPETFTSARRCGP